ncbi:MAG: aspartate aminotransferase family protein [Planctomycetes bacterium]|nr:aspartate aminotransferase family protein [Planctomycetota bacterium]
MSASLYERALEILPGGVSRNTVLRKPHPVYVDSAAGCRVTDVEGVERIDFSNNMASLIHGHAHPAIVAAVTEQLGKGTAFALATEVEVRYAEYLCSRNGAFERLRFVNSGTEATMGVLKASRAFTGRPKIAKVEGAYHGQYDYAEVSQTAGPASWGSADHPSSVPVAHGTPASALADVVIIPFNDPERAVSILDEHKGELACVLLDLMPHRVGLKPADAEFVSALRRWTREDGALLALDEVITFRSEFGGAQAWYDITPDLTALGKPIGGGFPVGAIAGRAEVMDVMNPLAKKVLFPHSGTFSANPMTLTAGLVAMELYDEAAVARLNALAKRAMDGIEDAIRSTGVRACVTGGGSMFRVHFKERAPLNYRQAYATPEEARQLTVLLDHLFDEGFMMINTCSAALSTAMGEPEIDGLVAAMKRGFAGM